MDPSSQPAPNDRAAPQALFRRQALDQLSTPDQLDQLMRLTRPVGWLALTVAGAVVAGLLAWGVYGRLAVTAEGPGIVLSGSTTAAYLYLPASAAPSLAPGMGVHLRPAGGGFGSGVELRGEVVGVAGFPAGRRDLGRRLGDDDLAEELLGDGPAVEVEVRLLPPLPGEATTTEATTTEATTTEATTTSDTAAALVHGRIVLGRARPLAFVVPGLGEWPG